MFELGIAPREIFLAYSTQFLFSAIRLVPGNVIMVAIDMWGKKPRHGGVDIWNHVKTCVFQYLIHLILIFNTFILIYFFIVDTASGLKFLFPTVYRFCLDGYVGSCFVVFIYLFLLFIYLFIYLFIIFLPLRLLFLFLLSLLSSLLLLLLLESLMPFVGAWLLLLLV